MLHHMPILLYLLIHIGVSVSEETLVNTDELVEELEESITAGQQVDIVNLVRSLVCGCNDYDQRSHVEVPPGSIDPLNPKPKVTDCYDILQLGQTSSGIYDIFSFNQETPIRVWCDMETDGGGWTVFQRREDGSVNFERDWNDYKMGFGVVSAEFWLGNDNLHTITNQNNYQLRVELDDFEGEQRYALYDHFRIGGENAKYKLLLGMYSGNAGDSTTTNDANNVQRNQVFSTRDEDNDALSSTHCATDRKGGWWYAKCGSANLNGVYRNVGPGPNSGDERFQGVRWAAWKEYYSMKRAEMKMRPNHNK